MITTFRKPYKEYPRNFWVLIGALFIDRIGGSLIFPFLALYITSKFQVGMREVGQIYAIYFGSAFIGSIIGGALADKYGRKTILVLGLVLSALSSILMGVINDWDLFFQLALVAGLLSEFGGPAVHAMITDILPVEKRASGFGILRIFINLSITIGPAIGGLLAGVNYLLLFIIDCVISLVTATIVMLSLPETKPQVQHPHHHVSIARTLMGYFKVLKDKFFVAFVFLSTCTELVYTQMNSTLSVFMRDFRAIPTQYYGYLLSVNAVLIVLFQFSVTRLVKCLHPLLVMMVGNVLYALGFGLFSVTRSFWHFVIAMVIITGAEMVNAPVRQTLIANLAPEDMRARYIAVFHTGWGVAAALGPLAAGIVIDSFSPILVWYAAGILCSFVALGYLVLKMRIGHRLKPIAHYANENMA